ncbi:hypothetical protein COB55_04495 [Candidatus Wolfebacteria bacterium]|nr:MAG: hypothetical protein COB55_04495 [Candidatus Wolfebacteria bacterium]
MEVIDITQTCGACPSQWEGKLKDGRMFYARYRWGFLSIEISKQPTDDIRMAMEEQVYGEQLGDGFDGVLSENTLKEKMIESGFTFEL